MGIEKKGIKMDGRRNGLRGGIMFIKSTEDKVTRYVCV